MWYRGLSDMRRTILLSMLLLSLIVVTSLQSVPTTRWVDPLCGDVSTYVSATRACTGGSEINRDTVAEGVALTLGGDTLNVRGASGGFDGIHPIAAEFTAWPTTGAEGSYAV